jgi:hypothetical protein
VSVDSAIMAESKVKYVKPVPWEWYKRCRIFPTPFSML